MQQLDPVDARAGMLRPEARIAEHDSEGRRHAQRLFVNEGQIVGIEWIAAVAETEAVENRIALGVGLFDVLKRPVAQRVVVDRHVISGSGPLEQRRRFVLEALHGFAMKVGRKRDALCGRFDLEHAAQIGP